MSPIPPTDRPARAHSLRRMPALLALGSLGLLGAACGSTAPAATSATTAPTSPAGTANTHRTGARHRRGRATLGLITALPSSAVDLRVHGKVETILLGPATTYRQGKTTVPASALKTGERVRVVLSPSAASPTAETVVVLGTATPRSGTVSALSSTGFVLTSPSGKATTVDTSPATTYRSGTSAAAASALRDGETVRVVGKTGSSGSIAATKVIIKVG